MYSLLIETATERGIVSLMQGSECLFHRDLPYGLSNSKFLLPAIAEGLKLSDVGAKELSFVAVGIGPGSYTGIRVAVATAQAIAYGVRIPLIGVSTLTCFAPREEGRFAVLIDAKIGGVYVLTGRRLPSGEVVVDSPAAIVPIAKLFGLLDGIASIVTPNATVLRPKLEAFPGAPSSLKEWRWEESAPIPHLMGKVADEMLLRGNVTKQGPLDLLYLRKTQAEENRLLGSIYDESQ